MNNSQYRVLADLDQNGFGIKYENRLSAYTPPHWHRALEILLFVKGSISCKFEHSAFHAKAGDIYLINSLEVHETRCSPDAVYLCVHILPGEMVRYIPDFDQLCFSLAVDTGDCIKREALDRLRFHMEQILRLMKDKPQAYQLEQRAHLFSVTAVLVKHFSRAMPLEECNLQRSDMNRLEPLLEAVQLRHGEDLSLDWACGELGLNKEYFCRMFKKNMGISFLQYLYQVRTAAVCRELELSDEPISGIAGRHGFRDPKMLSQYFRELYGCTPSEKRRFFREVTIENQ